MICNNSGNIEITRVTLNNHLVYTYHITHSIIPNIIQSLSPSKTNAIQTKIEKALNDNNIKIPDRIEADDTLNRTIKYNIADTWNQQNTITFRGKKTCSHVRVRIFPAKFILQKAQPILSN